MKKIITISLFFFSIIFISKYVDSQCDSPSPYSPSNGTTVNTLTPTLCWMGGYNYYYGTLYVASDAGFNNMVYTYLFSPDENCKQIPGSYLQYGHWYWWRIGVVCPHGTAGSNSYNFQTSMVGLINNEIEVPNNFSLSQNYPNPFNPTTKIKFDIPLSRGVSEGRGVFVSLTIYDILGREVATLVNEELKPGSYEYEWGGSNFASGVYFYQIIVSDPETSSGFTFKQTKRMVLLK